jgi:cytochrome c-type biogenesis protein CcmF
MLAEIGLVALTLSFFASLYALASSVLGERRQDEAWVLSGRNAALATFPLLTVAIAVLWAGLIGEHYQMSYVWSVSDPQTPLFYRITALWGSQKGSLLFWCWLTSAFAFFAIWLNWKSDHRLMPYAIAYMMAVLAFFVGLTLFIENPFMRWWVDPTTGEAFQSALIPANALLPDAQRLRDTANGLNPLLRHFGMIIHPPMLYLGFVGFTVPCAFAVSALASGDLSTNWIKATRRWTLVAWLFLSLGLILGGRWAYDVLGWGGYWGWDPVENAAFLPWLVGTAFLHSVMIQEKRGMLKVWNMALVILTFSAVMFGTFATRSGVIESVHSFARSSVGAPMLSFWAGITVVSTTLLLYRWQRGELRDEHKFNGLLSRETLFVLNNVVFVALTLVIFWGSFGAPILSELLFDTSITLGVDYFMLVTPPLFAVMYVLMGVAPLSAWSANTLARLGSAMLVPLALTSVTLFVLALTSPLTASAAVAYGVVFLAGYVALYEFWRGVRARMTARGEGAFTALLRLFARNQRRYGGYIVHLGIAVIGIGVIGSTLFQLETRRTLAIGDVARIDSQYTVSYDGFERGLSVDGRVINTATMSVYRNGTLVSVVEPRIDEYPNMPMTIAGAHSTLEKDFYVLLTGFDDSTQVASFKIYINPLVNLVWWGGLVLILGTVLAAYPNEVVPVSVSKPKRAPSAPEKQEAVAHA